jgi:hypothetical protein
MGSLSDRRRALVVDAQVRRFYFAVVALSALEVALLATLGLLLRRAALPAGPAGWLILAIAGTALGATVLALGLAAYVAVQTHRTAGAALHIQQAIKELRTTKHSQRVVLRPGDYLHDVAEEVNGLVTDLQPEASQAATRN